MVARQRAQDIRERGLTPAILAEDERDLGEAQAAGSGQLFKAADFLDVDDLLQRRHSPPNPRLPSGPAVGGLRGRAAATRFLGPVSKKSNQHLHAVAVNRRVRISSSKNREATAPEQ